MKAQIWSFDFAVSIVIFIVTLLIVFFSWNYANSHSVEQIQLSGLQDEALSVSDVLIRTSGVPENWTNTSVKIIGLAHTEKILSDEKIQQFISMDYQSARSVLGLGNADFYFQIKQTNGTVVQAGGENITFGNPPANASTIVPVERYVLLNGEIIRMEFTVWV